MSELTRVHLVRHGEVENPGKILYGRLPGYGLSALGRRMADVVAEWMQGRDVTVLVSSPLERAQQTAEPIAAVTGLHVTLDKRAVEAENHFEGLSFGVGDGSLRHPQHWRYMVNPFRPSWGEAYVDVAARMKSAVDAARSRAEGHEAVIVSHQLPIWITRRSLEGRRLWHDPRKRQCTLASVTSFAYDGEVLTSVSYAEPARALLPNASAVSGA